MKRSIFDHSILSIIQNEHPKISYGSGMWSVFEYKTKAAEKENQKIDPCN